MILIMTNNYNDFSPMFFWFQKIFLKERLNKHNIQIKI